MNSIISELTANIYDTIMENVGMTPIHAKFNLNLSSDEWTDTDKGEMGFKYLGKHIRIKISIDG